MIKSISSWAALLFYKDASGDLAWKTCEFDAEQNDILTIVYKKDYSGDEYGDCVYVRNFSCGTPIVVTLHANNGTNDTKTQNIYGGKGTLNANTFTCEGKVFAGWATTPDGNVTYSDGAEISPTEAMELYAVWGNAYTITFDYNDGKTAKKTVDVAQDSAIGAVNMPADPSRTGYIFGGWYADGGKDALTKDTVISASVTYTAKWTPITYTIVLNPGDGTGEPVTLPVATYDQEVILPANTFTRDGYEFNGWSTSSGSSYGSYKDQDTVKNLTNKDGNSVNLYATWRGKSVSVTVNPNYAGAQTTTRTGTVGSNYNYDNGNFNAIADPTRTGYIFDGWFNAAEGGTEITNQYKFTAEDAENGITLYAHWTKGITVHFDGNGYKNTNSLKDKTVTPDKVFSSLPYTSKYYYPANKALDGWYIKTADGSFGEAVTKDTKFDGLDEVTLIAKWRDYQYIIKYSLKYSDKSSTTGTMADQPAPFGQDVKLSKCTYVRDGYDFAGWAENSYSSTAKYKDEGTINREWDDDDYGYGSEDNESYTLYAMWTKSAAVDPDKQAADAALTQAETAIKVDYYPTYGSDKSATDMVQAKLTAANVSGVTVALKSGATVQSGTDLAAVKDDGSIQYNWNETNVVSGEAWRCFKSSNPDVISHENLLVTRQKENKAVTITSCLSSDRFGRYESVYPDACFKELTRQIVSASVIVKGTEPTHSGVVSEKSQVSFTLQTANSTWITKTTVYDLPEGTTVFDVFKRVLGSNNYTYGARGSYIYSITSPSGETLGEFDLGENSGWMYKVNGVIVDQYMNAQTVSNRDNIVVFFTKDYTEETGYGHSGGSWNGTNAADKKAAASVDDLISAIGGVRLSSEKDIAAARAAYDKLTDAQKKLVSNYDILTAAEQALADLKAGKLPFTDVQAGAWYADAVKYVFDQGLMSGMSAQEFGPDGQVTRGQVVTILWRLAGSPTVSGKAFPDVSASAWYADAVAWASANGVVSGYENGGFGPGDPVTREQLAAILYRYAQLSGKDTDQTADLSGYTDSVTISAWAPQALKWAVGSGLISGTGTHTLSPRGTATRAQIAVILQNFCK
ncbi:InlB B-repeat-containing protein [Lawsonibacter sp. LCP25S3_F5]